MSSNEALAKFMRNPRPFLDAQLPRPPCKLCILGPPHAGKTRLAAVLAERYSGKVLNVDALIRPRRQAAKDKMLQETRDEAVESAISKVTAARQAQQTEAQESTWVGWVGGGAGRSRL